ncbi:DUF4365 domain-containing protein [Nitrosomonas sp.]|uniref:DUF4365 domain-containing protein n=1 Tax=Nitrosomonas sp. TaxID=42353 RepID=UPI0025E65144|nr:DUF4365 domain-containing protein [Nitrosomonas sp.]MBY0485381.1 DUF4365 domain-containing protein [Nitrosomonas sp.]
MNKKQRSLNQIKEDISIRVLREKLPQEWVVHSYGADYGIDCVIELFDFVDEDKKIAETLGENFFVQLKASDCIKYTKRKAYGRGNVAKGTLSINKKDLIEISVAKFQLDMSDILTIQSIGIAIPVLLILIDTNTERAFFMCLNDYIDKVLIPEDPHYASKGSKIIYIPTDNEIINEKDALVPLRAYGKRSKMYGAFALFSYQLKEIWRIQGRAAAPHKTSLDQAVNMIKTFIDISMKQDIWSGHEFWEPIGRSFAELSELKIKLEKGVKDEDYEQLLYYCSDYIWHRLTNLANMYEELVREWFMPTYLAQLTSYPDKSDRNEVHEKT